ncbi:DUF6458 family protein [Microbacterium stercoris]|uniref:DUF6458 domain-containing protein n=1 Tax=Microbacterium stercoris TaxID=2820289 RepID=A0A939QJE9_9MICO|nr:DUF6458 family protein [Microbacterium stercoris]MBO3662787.1 hypothetical protein [Microbacterium stercoris]
MSIGTGVVLFVIGAILAFGLELDIPAVNDDFIGYLLMGAGVVVFIVGIVLMTRRRSAVTSTRTVGDPAAGQQVTERRTDVDPY